VGQIAVTASTKPSDGEAEENGDLERLLSILTLCKLS